MSELLKGFEEHVYRQLRHEDVIGKALFVFDTNILLNIYRWKKETFQDFIECVGKIGKDNVFVTHQIKSEFFRNRTTHAFVFTGFSHLGEDLATAARNRCKADFEQHMRGDLKEKLLTELESAFRQLADTVNTIINREFQDRLSLLKNDLFLERLASVISNVYSPFDEARRKALEAEAGQRRNKILADKAAAKNTDKNDVEKFPGFSDSEKGYGDYIILHELLTLAQEKGKDIVFVTDEKKDDWFHKVHGRVESIRLNVKRKFIDVSQYLDIWDSPEFIERIAKAKNLKIEDTTVLDVQRVAQETKDGSFASYRAPDIEDDDCALPKTTGENMPPEELDVDSGEASLPEEDDGEVAEDEIVKASEKATERKGA